MTYTTVLFSGGGLKGSAHCGALAAVEVIEQSNVGCSAIGTSIGGLVALGVVYNRAAHEIVRAASKSKLDDLIGRANHVVDLLLGESGKGAGLRSSHVLKAKIGEYMRHLSIRQDVTFRDVYDVTKHALTVTATTLKTGTLKVFSAETTPDVQVIDALTASASVPLMFQPCTIDNEAFVDGGILSNFPLHLLPDEPTSLALNLNPPDKPFQGTETTTLEYIAHLMFIGGKQADRDRRAEIQRATILDIDTPLTCGLFGEAVDLTGCGFIQVIRSQAPDTWERLRYISGTTTALLADIWRAS